MRIRMGVARVVAVAGLASAGLVLAAPAPVSAAVSSDTPARTWGTNGRVLAILPAGDRVYLAGDFTAVSDPSGNVYPVTNLAVFLPDSGSFDTAWHPDLNGVVNALAVSGEELFIGGGFTTVDGQPASRLADLSAATGQLNPAWAAGANNMVSALAVSNDMLYVGGTFTQLNDAGGQHEQPYLGRMSIADGSVDPSWNPQPDAQVRALAISGDGSQVFVGGDFQSVSGQTRALHITSLDTVSGALTPTFTSRQTNGTASPPAYGLAVDGSNLLAAVGGSGGACASLNASTGATQWSKHTNGNAQSVTALEGIVYCGGHFTGSGAFAGLTRYKLAAVEEQTGQVLSFAPVINSALGVWSVGSDSDHVYVGGDFTRISAKEQSRFAAFIRDGAQTVAGVPQGLTARPGDSSARLFWSQPWTDGGYTVTRYRIYRGADGGPLSSVATTRLTSWTDTSVTNGVSYQYAVAAMNALGDSALSSTQTTVPSPDSYLPPTAPQTLSAPSPSPTGRLTWGAPLDDGRSPVTGYLILRSTERGMEQQIASIAAPSTLYTDTQVTAGTTYYYQVVAVNAIGTSDPSNETSVAVTVSKPAKPALSVSTASGSVVMSWSAPDSGTYPIKSYTILRDSVQYAHLKATVFSYVDSGAVSGTTYTYQLRATSLAGNSPLSDPVTVVAP